MNRNNKGRHRWHGATPKTIYSQNRTTSRATIKGPIVRLALRGLLPISFATRLIQRGGLKDA